MLILSLRISKYYIILKKNKKTKKTPSNMHYIFLFYG
jgi:hypothetical protein